MNNLAFRLRIALLSALISGLVMGAFSATAWHLMRRERLQALDREIRALAYRHPGWMGEHLNYERLTSVIALIFGEENKEDLILLAADAGGTIRYRSPHWPKDLDPKSIDLRLEEAAHPIRPPGAYQVSGQPSDESLTTTQAALSRGISEERALTAGPPYGRKRGGISSSNGFSKKPRFQTVRTAQATWRMGVLGDQNDRLVLGMDLAELQAEWRRVRNAFLLALPLVLFAIGGGGWWVAGYAVRPLRSIASVAEGVTAHGLDQRIPPSGQDPEVTRLIRVLNGMMDRLEASFKQATRFSADASHELKTPLSIMQGELEHALQTAVPGSPEQQTFAHLLEEIQRLKSTTRSLLLLSQADAGQLPLTLERFNLSPILGELSEDMEALAVESHIKVEVNIAPAIWVEADRLLLPQAVLNLLQNSLRYNEPNGWIKVTLASLHRRIELHVCNGGPGITPADQPRLFNRFFRADRARSRNVDGVGLGLSLAREIARAHHGDLVLKESQPGRTCFTLSLPAASRAENRPQDA